MRRDMRRRFRRPKRWVDFGGTKPSDLESAVNLLRYYAKFAQELRSRARSMGVAVYPHIKFDFYTDDNSTTLWSEEVCAQTGLMYRVNENGVSRAVCMDEYTERFIGMLDDVCRRYRMGWWSTEGGILDARRTIHFSRDEKLGTRRARESDVCPGYGESDSDDPHDEFGQCFG